MHYYAFGSVCRGEIDGYSDVDILVCCNDSDTANLPVEKYSIYTYGRLRELWSEGNPFAWHLHKESKLLFGSNGSDFIKELGEPAPYINHLNDINKFGSLFDKSIDSIVTSRDNIIFDISCLYLAIRNIATCFSLYEGTPYFSRYSPLLIDNRLNVSDSVFSILLRARILSTRGVGDILTEIEIESVLNDLDYMKVWKDCIVNTVNE